MVQPAQESLPLQVYCSTPALSGYTQRAQSREGVRAGLEDVRLARIRVTGRGEPGRLWPLQQTAGTEHQQVLRHSELQ